MINPSISFTFPREINGVESGNELSAPKMVERKEP